MDDDEQFWHFFTVNSIHADDDVGSTTKHVFLITITGSGLLIWSRRHFWVVLSQLFAKLSSWKPARCFVLGYSSFWGVVTWFECHQQLPQGWTPQLDYSSQTPPYYYWLLPHSYCSPSSSTSSSHYYSWASCLYCMALLLLIKPHSTTIATATAIVYYFIAAATDYWSWQEQFELAAWSSHSFRSVSSHSHSHSDSVVCLSWAPCLHAFDKQSFTSVLGFALRKEP